MKSFLLKCLLFVSSLLILLVGTLFYLPNNKTPNYLYAVIFKDDLFKETSSPKIVIIGGSNVQKGLDSSKISNYFQYPVVNMGATAPLGLVYMLRAAEPVINEGDFVVMIPEYHQFENMFYGEHPLVVAIFDIIPEFRENMPFIQWMYLLRYMPNHSATKLINNFRQDARFRIPRQKNSRDKIQLNQWFNQYGDYKTDWEEVNSKPYPKINIAKLEGRKINHSVFKHIKKFTDEMDDKNVRWIFLPPCFHESAFNSISNHIYAINAKLLESEIGYGVDPARYKMKDELFYDTYYHPNNLGIDIRTDLVIEDLKMIIDEK